MKIACLTLFLILFSWSCSEDATSPEMPEPSGETPPAAGELDPFQQNQLIGRGINLGNALEAPNEGDWGVVLEEYFFDEIVDAGFNSVRIPVRWSAHALPNAPYTIETAFLERVKWAVDQSLSRNLIAIVNMHHYDEIFEDPDNHIERFLAMWTQIADYFSQRDGKLIFELLNEPHNNLGGDQWNMLLADAIAIVRQSNPGRTLIVGPDQYNSIYALDRLVLPSDNNIIVTAHYYGPFQFTHQGAEWVDGSDAWLGTTWNGTIPERDALQAELQIAEQWGIQQNRPIHIGEFGAYSRADMPSRARWTAFVVGSAEAFNMSWSYWEFCAGFGAYDKNSRTWRSELLNALIPGS